MNDINEKLSVLTRERVEPIRLKRSKVYLFFPAVIVLFVVIAVWHNRQLFQSAVSVKVESAIAVNSSANFANIPENSVVFQAAGWVEADPFSTKISPFIAGILDEVRVIDGQAVKKDEALAVINSEELELEVATLKNMVEQQKIRIEMAKTAENKVRATILQLAKKVAALKAETAKSKNFSDSYQENQETLSKLAVDQARLAYEKALAAQLEVEHQAFELQKDLKLAGQKVELAKSELRGSELRLQKLLLDLSRCVVKSPVDGVVMDLKSAPGQSVAGGEELMQVFDPESLQVRVDVLFADAPALHINQRAKVKLDALPGRLLDGVVTSIVGQADVQRNTVQAKVKIVNPDSVLRPEMLARVQFLASPVDKVGGTDDVEEAVVTVIPVAGLINRNGNRAKVWVVSRRGQLAESRDVRLGVVRETGWIESYGGVNPGEWVVISPPADLENGQKVNVAK